MAVDKRVAAGGDVGPRRHDPRRHRGIEREHLILLGLGNKGRLHLLHLLRVLGGQVGALAEVTLEVVELQHLVVERIRVGRAEGLPRGPVHLGAQQPALVVKRPLAEHLEILGFMARRRLGIFGVKGVGKAGALDRFLGDAIHHVGRLQAGSLKDGRHHVDHVHELLAQAALVLDARRP